MLVAAKRTPDLYLVPERMSEFLHFSLHADDAHWHYKVLLGHEDKKQNWRPLPAVDGARLALTIDFRLGSLRLPVHEDTDKVDIWVGGNTRRGSLLVELFLLEGDLPRVRPTGRDAVLCGGIRMSDGRGGSLGRQRRPGFPSTTYAPPSSRRDDTRATPRVRFVGPLGSHAVSVWAGRIPDHH